MSHKLISLVIKVCDWVAGLESEFDELEKKNDERRSKHDLKMKEMEKEFKEQDSRVERINFRKDK